MLWIALSLALLGVAVHFFVYEPLFLSLRSRIPGPKLFALTKWRLAYEDWRGTRTRTIEALHKQYGPVVRIGPNEVHFNSLAALRTIYGAGSGYERTNFYRMFDVYGKQNLFTFQSTMQHAERKKMVANAYSKSLMLKGASARMVENKVKEYMDLIADNGDGNANEIFSSLHYFSIDSITHFLYGPKQGGTSALTGNVTHRSLLDDIIDPARKRLSWFAVHLSSFTRWLYTRTHFLERLSKPLLPMEKPATYTGIRTHALKAFQDFKKAVEAGNVEAFGEPTIIAQLWKFHISQKADGLEDLDIASECADHLLAGIDTTSDTLMFLIWVLSLPENRLVQQKLIAEVKSIPPAALNHSGVPTVEAAGKLVYLDAVIKETLRLYSPLPASEPRSLPRDSVISGYAIPAGTVVAMSPYSLHRNADIFKDPQVFCPDRWFGQAEDVTMMNRWFWAFSSGGRMCIGLQ